MSDRPLSAGMPLLLFALALFAAGGGWLLSQTIVRDIRHPDYSTLNDTPRGARLLFEALEQTPLEARRLFELNDLPPNATLFRIGQPLSSLRLERLLSDPDDAAFVASGGRLVSAFAGRAPDECRPCARTACAKGICDAASDTNRTVATPRIIQGLALRSHTNLTTHARAAVRGDRVPWYSAASFVIAGDATNRWRTLYTLEGYPVMIESRFGKGSLVLATDCYHLSNEALAKDRRTALLTALIGPSRSVLFDETVHGLAERRNTAWLLHRYRLHALVAVFALLFALALWQQACPLLPHQTEAADAPQRGFRMEDGLVCLLRKHLPPERLPRQLAELGEQAPRACDPAAREEMLALLARDEASHAPPEETIRALYALAQRKRPPAPESRPANLSERTSGDTP